jgi:hypothetical protein
LPSDNNEWLFTVTSGMIQSMPLTGTRSAAYRLLATIPGVQNLGTVMDNRGRSGSAVAFADHNINGSFQDQLIIDQRPDRR